ncbi:MAG: N-acetylmuramoyl-L-alanine amidase [Desulfurivibrionaceae bacterium]|nr:N-acetylmuramoyl-L-alanine amidase [Desulfurivibrionaceae bacterium]
MMSFSSKIKRHPPAIFLAALIALALSVTSLSGLVAAKDKPAERYAQAKEYSRQVKTDASLAGERRNWLAAVKRFRDIYQTDRSHHLAPSSLFMMARLYREMYGLFNNSVDLSEAIAYYEDLVSLYPKSSLGDDALLAIADIHFNEGQNPEKGGRYLRRLLRIYPAGDRVPAAAAALKKLPAESSPAPPVLLTDVKKNLIEPAGRTGGMGGGQTAELKPLRYWSNDNYTRVVIETTTPVKYRENLLKKSGDNPRRLYVDLENCRIAPQLQAPIPINDGLLKRVRSGQHLPDTTRVVLDTQSLSDYKIFSLQDPFRIVIDLKGQPKQAGDPGAPAQAAPLLASAKIAANDNESAGSGYPPTLARQLGLGIKRIVLDPGHGGKDPGAVGKNGLLEKDIVLGIALQLAPKLEKKLGCEVILTRDRDVFVPLEERTAIANSKEADLFISIHVNASPNPKARGVETYILDLARNQNAMELAARENATSTSRISDLQNILLDLIQNSKKSESIKLAEYVQDNMANGLLPRYPIRNLGVKQAPFIVLVGAQMPAILTEVAFISNHTEARWLQSPDYITSITEQMAGGISSYVNELNLASLDFR